jgi:hypothetical protein
MRSGPYVSTVLPEGSGTFHHSTDVVIVVLVHGTLMQAHTAHDALRVSFQRRGAVHAHRVYLADISLGQDPPSATTALQGNTRIQPGILSLPARGAPPVRLQQKQVAPTAHHVHMGSKCIGGAPPCATTAPWGGSPPRPVLHIAPRARRVGLYQRPGVPAAQSVRPGGIRCRRRVQACAANA